MGRKVLVVDDEPLVLDVVATMLEELGCDVETAHTGADALNRLGSEEHIDILLADINMPGLDGRKLSLPVQGCNGDLETVPVKLLRTLAPHKVILTELARPIVVSRAPSFST